MLAFGSARLAPRFAEEAWRYVAGRLRITREDSIWNDMRERGPHWNSECTSSYYWLYALPTVFLSLRWEARTSSPPRRFVAAFQSLQDGDGDSDKTPTVRDQMFASLTAELNHFRETRSKPDPEAPPPTPAASDSARASDRAQEVESASEGGAMGGNRVDGALSPNQANLLRQLITASEPPATDLLDGRVLNALCRRGLVKVEGGHANATEEGERYFVGKVRRRRRVRSAPTTPAGPIDRAEVIRQATQLLETVLPSHTSYQVGDLTLDTPELLSALGGLANQMRSGLA